MRTLKNRPRQFSRPNYAGLSLLLASLFFVGLGLGNLVFASPHQAGPAVGTDNKPPGGAVVNPPFQVYDFALTNQAGAPMSLKDLRGQAVLLFFGYTHCPDVCPDTLANFRQVKKSLGTQATGVTFVLVTVDSQRDTPDVLKDYLNRFDPGFIGLTGDEATLGSIAAEYGAYFSLPADQQQGAGHTHQHGQGIASDNYFVQHSSPSYLIDPKGFLRMVYFNGTSAEVIANGIRQILQEAS